MSDPTTILTSLGSAGILSFLIETLRMVYASRKEREELERRVDITPITNESLLLGNAEQALAIQKGVIERLNAHIAWQDDEIAHLRQSLISRDERIAELEATANGLRHQVDMLFAQIAALRGEFLDPSEGAAL